MIVLANGLNIPEIATGGGVTNPNSPLIGYDQKVTISNIAASSAATDFPATNMANPATFLKWKATSTAANTVTVSTLAGLSDYVGIAAHNLGSKVIPITIEGNTGAGFVTIVQATTLPDDQPTIFRFPSALYTSIRLSLGVGTAEAEIGVLFVGRLLTLQRRIYVGHTPIKFGRSTKIVNGMSESGQYLGRIIVGQSRDSAFSIQNMTPGWYRQNFDPFLVAAKDSPFFWAWRPFSFATEVGYVWLRNDPKVVNQRTNGMMNVSLEISGYFDNSGQTESIVVGDGSDPGVIQL